MKIAIYSGSFNPIHNGHLAIAEAALSEGYDEVWLIVSPQNPHKKDEDLWPFDERLAMARLAIKGRKGMLVSDCEANLPRPSYTINTLEYLKRTFPDHQFRLLIGEDNLTNFRLWKEHQRIIESFGLILYPRGTGMTNEFTAHSNIHRIHAPLLEISSSEIRKLLETNSSIEGLVSPEVEKFILDKLKNDHSKSVF